MNVNKPLPKTPNEHKEDTYNQLTKNANQTSKHRNQGVKQAYDKLTANSKQSPKQKKQPKNRQITSRHTIP